MKARTANRLAWSLWALATALILGALTSLLTRPHTETIMDVAPVFVALLGFPALGTLIATRRRENPIGWLFLAGAALLGLGVASTEYVDRSLIMHPGSLPGTVWVAWINSWSWVVGLALIIGFTPFLFPDGRVASRRWGPVMAAAVMVFVLVFSAEALKPGVSEDYPIRNPLGIESAGGLIDAVLRIGYPALVVLLCAGVVSLFVRMRRAGGEERRQIRWFVYAVGISVTGIIIGSIGAAQGIDALTFGWVVGLIGLASMPVAAAIGIFKYRLYDIDVVTVVYGILAAFVTLVYVGIVVGVGAVIGSRGNLLLSILATAIIAVAFQPVRRWAGHLANRIVYGKRATPYEVLSELAQGMGGGYSAEDVLPRMASIVGQGTGAARAEVWLRVGDDLRREGVWPDADADRASLRIGNDLPPIPGADRSVPVEHRDELLGALAVTMPRNESLSPANHELLRDVASQAGLVLRNVRLIEELRASRQRLVAAQDHERRRLERNIHDGAQQQLVALSVKMRLLKALARKDPAKAEELVDQLQADAQDALGDLRDLARGIYPPLLADKGLAAALEAQARKVPFPVRVEPNGVGRYSADAEATAYFCVLEALQNAAKYAEASSATVRLGRDDGNLVFAVTDDGRGFDPATTPLGSGLQNMADRVEALGGTIEVASTPGVGTTITGSIPVSG
jgi:signal transduction histidine kinase